MLGWSDGKFARKLGVSHQSAEELLDHNSTSPQPETSEDLVTFMADKVAKRYKVKPQQQERQSD